jgi:hypothetical protein
VKRARLAAALAACLGALAAAAVATAATSGGGAIRLIATGGNSPNQKILVVGAIGDYGTASSVDQNGKPAQNGNFEEIRLQKGSFLINATTFNAAGNKVRPVIASRKNCSVLASWHAPASIVSGTGAYKGISGTLKLQGTFAGVGRKFTSGPHKGQCNMNSEPKALQIAVTGSGKVKFS